MSTNTAPVLPNLDRWMEEYHKNLLKAVMEHPNEYGAMGWGDEAKQEKVEQTTAAMRACIAKDNRGFNKDGRAFRATCKAFGIPHTYTAIEAFLRNTQAA